jgi:hypothetical protein
MPDENNRMTINSLMVSSINASDTLHKILRHTS